MATLMPQSELVKRALQWISEEKICREVNVQKLIDEAAARFNLGPKDVIFLEHFFQNHPDKTLEHP